MQTMKVDTIVTKNATSIIINRLNIGKIRRDCQKLTVHKKVKHRKTGDFMYFPERVFFKYSWRNGIVAVKILPFYKPRKQ